MQFLLTVFKYSIFRRSLWYSRSRRATSCVGFIVQVTKNAVSVQIVKYYGLIWYSRKYTR